MYFYIYIIKFYNEYNNETEDIRGITYGSLMQMPRLR